jgi:5'-3' exonuclease
MKSQANFSVIFFRTMATCISRFKPSYVHFFWDSPKDQVWRKQIYTEYKDGRQQTKHEEYDVNALLKHCTEIIKSVTHVIGCKNYEKLGEEADDLIYAFCKQNRAEKVIIISSDNDFQQIPFMMDNVDLCCPNKIERYQRDTVDPVEIKCFMGEKGDNIPGYEQIGPVRARQLVLDPVKRSEFLKTNGDEIYTRNRKLIDLSLAPNLLENCKYIAEAMALPSKFDMKELNSVILKNKIKGLTSEVSRVILPYKFMEDARNAQSQKS